MLIDFNFRHFQPSDELVLYVSEQLHKHIQVNRKSVRAKVVFSSQKKTKRVDITLTGGPSGKGYGLHLHAEAEAEDFFKCIEMASERLSRQFHKSKARKKTARCRVG